MKSWFAVLAATSALALALTGCSEPTPSSTDTAKPADSGKSSDAPKTDDTPKAGDKPAEKTDAAKAPEAPKGDVDAQGLPNKPKDGDDVAVLETAKGKIVFMFLPDKAPKTVDNFKSLAKDKFYDGTRFHRCIPGFMIQGGDPYSKDISKAGQWGTGGHTVNGKEENVPDEFNSVKHVAGIVSMAHSMAPNSASSQFFIVTTDSTFLDGQYTAFGKVLSGQEVADEIVKTGAGGDNGAVEASKAIVLKSVKIAKWPVK